MTRHDAGLDVVLVGAARVRPLRAAVLRPGLPSEQSVYPTDDAADTGHVAALVDGRVVGVGSIAREALPDHPPLVLPRPAGNVAADRTWRLRGMAVDERLRGRGIGAAVLARLEAHAVAHGAGLLWANARDGARAFYLAHGWQVASAGFELPDIGGHHVMVRSTETRRRPSAAGSPA